MLDDEEVSKNKYKSILENVYGIIGDGTKIIKNKILPLLYEKNKLIGEIKLKIYLPH